MASSSFLLFALIGAFALVNCQFDRDEDRRRPRPRPPVDNRGPSRDAACNNKVMDIYFLMDSSSSIYINEFLSQHGFVRDVIRRFDVSRDNTRVGMLTYSDDLERPTISLDRYQSVNELINGITTQSLPYRTGTTNTDLAIRHVRQLPEFRRDITKVMVVITDGGSSSPGSTAREAELARAAGFYMVVVGIGQYLEEREWRSIASDQDFIYNITSPRLLENVKFSLPPRVCALPPIILGASCSVNRLSEIYFVASRSASDQAIPLIESFKDSTRDARDSLRISYMIEACRSATNTALDDSSVACDRFFRRSGDTAESNRALFTRARALARESSNNAGRGANQVIVLFADEDSLSLSRFGWIDEADDAKKFDGITVVVVDLGLRQFTEFPQLIASPNSVVNFLGGSLESQNNAQRLFINMICNASNQQNRNNFNGTPQ